MNVTLQTIGLAFCFISALILAFVEIQFFRAKEKYGSKFAILSSGLLSVGFILQLIAMEL
jgi:hypothetical protein